MKRTFWTAIGAGFGFGLSFWTMRALRRLADRFLPAAMLERVERTLDSLDGGTGSRRTLAPVDGRSAAEAPWRAGGGHPSVTGLRALAGGRRGGGR